MRALLTKNRVPLTVAFLLGAMILIPQVLRVGFREAFVDPLPMVYASQSNAYTFSAGLVLSWYWIGIALGWLVGYSDRLRGVADYVAHRGVSRARLFFGQVGVYLCVLLVLMVLPWIVLAIFGESRFEPDYWGLGMAKVAGCTPMLTSFSLGLLLSQLRWWLPLRIVLTFVLVWTLKGSEPAAWVSYQMGLDPKVWALKNVGLTAMFLLAAWWAHLDGADPDLPPTKYSVLPIAVVLTALGIGIYSPILELTGRTLINVHSTDVGIDSSGTAVVHTYKIVPAPFGETVPEAARGWDAPKGHMRQYYEIPANGVDDLKPIAPPERIDFNPASTTHVHSKGRRVFRRQYGNPGASEDALSAYANTPEGCVTLLVERGLHTGERTLLRKPTGRFSDATSFPPAGSNRDRGFLWIGDPEDGTLYSLDLGQGAQTFLPVPLPHGWLFENWIVDSREFLTDKLRKNIKAQFDLPEWHHLTFFITNKGIMYLDSGTRTAMSLSEEQTEWVLDSRFAFTVPNGVPTGGVYRQREDWALITFDETVTDPGGNVILEHRSGPRTFENYAWAGMLTALSALRAPIVQPFAFGNMEKGSTQHPFGVVSPTSYQDWILKYEFYESSKSALRAWLGMPFSFWSLPIWALLALLAWATRRRLKRFGATGHRLWIWPLAIMCFGVLAALACWITERRRAYLPAAASDGAEAPAPLLKSA